MTAGRAAGLYQRIWSVVRRVPPGRVSTYGTIAKLAGCGARQVGYALSALPDGSDVPWQRIVNSQGRISLRSDSGNDEYQRVLLESEGVEFSMDGRINLARFGWPGKSAFGDPDLFSVPPLPGPLPGGERG
jgi:methylated-DNA-protein-cysteine methyltransferase-like protein